MKADELTTLFVEIAKHLGLEKFEAQVHQAHTTMVPCYYATLSYKIEVPLAQRMQMGTGPQEITRQIFSPIEEGIRNSPLMKQLVSEYTEKLRKQEMQIAELKVVVDRLAPFQTHYDLEFKMKHGKENK